MRAHYPKNLMFPSAAQRVISTVAKSLFAVAKQQLAISSQTQCARPLAPTSLSQMAAAFVATRVYAGGSQLTRRDILTELPFGNKTLLLEVDGAMVKAALENGVSKVEDSQGRFPHVSGLTFTYDKSKPAGSRVASVMIGGKPMDEGATFKTCRQRLHGWWW